MKNEKLKIFFIVYQTLISIKPNLIENFISFFWIIFVFIALNTILLYSKIYNDTYYLVPFSLILLINSSIIAVNIHRINLINNNYLLSTSYSIIFKIYIKYILFSIIIIFMDILISTLIISYLHFMIFILKDISYVEQIINPISHSFEINHFTKEIFIYFLQTPAHYLFSRLVLILPSIAINKNISLKKLWSMSKNNGLKLLILFHFLPWLYFNIISNLINKIEFSFDIIFISCMNLIAMYTTITFISLSYKYIKKF